jgi:hypothetical protein
LCEAAPARPALLIIVMLLVRYGTTGDLGTSVSPPGAVAGPGMDIGADDNHWILAAALLVTAAVPPPTADQKLLVISRSDSGSPIRRMRRYWEVDHGS